MTTQRTDTKLKGRDPKDAEPVRPKILIFGKAGVGKTWTSIEFPNVYYIDTEGGANLKHYTEKLRKAGGRYFGQEDGSLLFEAVIEQVQALATEKHDYKTLVIDSISKLWNTKLAEAGERLGDKNAFGADKKETIKPMRRLQRWIDQLDMNVIFIAHEKPEWFKGEQIGTTFDCWEKLAYDLHLNLEIKKLGDSRIALVRKSRLLGFPDGVTFPWSYQDFAERYGRDVIEKGDQKIAVLATPEQVKEVNRLLENVKLEPDAVEKWFTKANVDSFAEMTSEQITKVLDFLNKKIKGESK